MTELEELEAAHKTAIEALWHSEERYRKLSEIAVEDILIHDTGLAVDANSSFAKMFGYETEDLVGRNVIEMFSLPEYKDIILEKINAGFDKPYEIMAQRKDGTTFPLMIEAAREVSCEDRDLRLAAVRDMT